MGVAELDRMLAGAPARAISAMASAIYAEALGVMAKSQREVPVRYGILRASGMVYPPNVTSETADVTMGYGGAASGYAVIVHERRWYRDKTGTLRMVRHDRPTKAGFLVDPFNQALPRIPGRIARRIAGQLFTDSGPTGAGAGSSGGEI